MKIYTNKVTHSWYRVKVYKKTIQISSDQNQYSRNIFCNTCLIFEILLAGIRIFNQKLKFITLHNDTRVGQ